MENKKKVRNKAPPVFVLLGRGGAGKTETAPWVSKQTGLPVIELGRFIRQKAHQGDELAEKIVWRFMRRGFYFPGEWSIEFTRMALEESPEKFRNGFVVDGFPRTVKDLNLFTSFLQETGFRLRGGIELKISSVVSRRRQIQRQRRIEDENALRARETEFVKSERNVMDALRKSGMLYTIDAQVGGRKKRQKEFSGTTSRKAYELDNPRFLKRAARKVAKQLTRLRHK